MTDAVLFARSRISDGESETWCQACGEEIPEARRRALPGVRACVPCQVPRDSRPTLASFNRRGSKDSQLR